MKKRNWRGGRGREVGSPLLHWVVAGALLLAGLISLAPINGYAQNAPAAVTYYVSASAGSDGNSGLSPAAPLATISKVNSLALNPGDQVLFKCGDTWRLDPLILSRAGTEAAPIVFSSYPAGCPDLPALSGSRPVTGWTAEGGGVYHADLSPTEFPHGLNQLFRNGQRLTLGRWPNLDAPNGGYSFVDAHTAGGSQITDNELPPADWTGAIVHIKNIRWSMLDRQVTAAAGHALTLNQGLSCLVSGWGDCAGWGYFINNHRLTLDQDGEWYYDPVSRRVTLVSLGGPPAGIEASVILEAAQPWRLGGVQLSDGSTTAYVNLDNLEIKNWYNHGLGTPGGMSGGEIYHHLTVQNLYIHDVDAAGVNLSSWLERPANGRKGLRGGHHLTFSHNRIARANAFGVTGYFADSTFSDNTIEDIALIANLGAAGMGCGLTSAECTENGDGFRIRLYDERDSGFGNTLLRNRLANTGYNGVDVFGPRTTLQNNLIIRACVSKADCGGVRVFGDGDLASTPVHDVRLLDNLIVDIPGNVDGCHASRAAFGMGLYIDNYSRDVETRGNTVISTTVSGILYQRSSGVIAANTVFNASSGTEFSAQVDLGGSETRVTMSGNQLYALGSRAWTLYAASLSNFLTADNNYLFHPYVSNQIAYGPSWKRYTFAGWQAFSGLEAHSATNWFSQPAGEASRGRIFFNPTMAPLALDLGGRQYLDLDQNPLAGSLTLAPFSSQILVDNGPAPLALVSVAPNLVAAGRPAFTLAVRGSGFTPQSVVRWDGQPRPTRYVSAGELQADISAADVAAAAVHAVTVWDPAGGGLVTPARSVTVVAGLSPVYLPLVGKE